MIREKLDFSLRPENFDAHTQELLDKVAAVLDVCSSPRTPRRLVTKAASPVVHSPMAAAAASSVEHPSMATSSASPGVYVASPEMPHKLFVNSLREVGSQIMHKRQEIKTLQTEIAMGHASPEAAAKETSEFRSRGGGRATGPTAKHNRWQETT